MIATKAKASQADFEALLDTSKAMLMTTIRTAPSMSNREFEDTVARTMKEAAKRTPFNGAIKQTDDLDFPDIIAGEFYGVEVKKSTKAIFKTTGNSIFEQTRIAGVDSIYILMATPEGVRWAHYEAAIQDIVVTHSPRYSINLDAKETIFEKMGISYDDFRALSQSDKMERIRTLYDDSSLWWLSSKQEGFEYRFWNGLPKEEKDAMRIDMMIVCPRVFARDHQAAAVYCLGMGVINPSMRDVFSAGGKCKIKGKEYPQVYERLYNARDAVRNRFPHIDTEILASFWGGDIKGNVKARWQQWLDKVKIEGGRDVSGFFG